MSLALYRKYRPMSFAEVGGQAHIKKTLENEIKTGRVAQAYLFSGPRGIGKTTIARILAKSVNCLKRKEGKSEPCNNCAMCEEFNAGRSLDLLEIDAASHTGVDNVRENIIENVRFTPQRAKYKVFIIDEVHMLSTSAFNALLKTLEEPPEHVIFILCTTELHKLPETIISRCQRFDFRKPTKEEVIEKLKLDCSREKANVDAEVLQEIVRASDGFFRDAESLLAQVLTLGSKITLKEAELVIPQTNYNLVRELFQFLLDKKTKEALRLLETLTEEGIDLDNFYHQLLEYGREEVLGKIYGEPSKAAARDGTAVSLPELVAIVKILLNKEREIKLTDFPTLPLELAIIEICGADADAASSASELADNNQTAVAAPANNKKEKSGVYDKKAAGRMVEKKETEVNNEAESATASPAASAKNKISLEQVKESWNKIISLSKKFNHALPFILKVAQPLRIDEGKLTLGFIYDFHLERMRDKKNKNALEDIIKAEFGEDMTIVASRLEKVVWDKHQNNVVREAEVKAEETTADSDGLLDNILDVFGGKVVG